MAIFTKVLHSGSVYGTPITVTASASPGTIIHSTGISSSVIDEVWIYANNTGLSQTVLTLEYGGTASNNKIILPVPAQSGLTIAAAGLILTGTGTTSSTIRAYASNPNTINIAGYINRIS